MSFISPVSHEQTSCLHSHHYNRIRRDCSIGFCHSRRMVLVDIHCGTVLIISGEALLDTLFPDPYIRDIQIMERTHLAHVARPVVCRWRGRTEGGGFK